MRAQKIIVMGGMCDFNRSKVPRAKWEGERQQSQEQSVSLLFLVTFVTQISAAGSLEVGIVKICCEHP